jgi:glycosidase
MANSYNDSNISWFKNAIIYHILIDRFSGFDSTDNWEKPIFLGGTIKGIIKKLPYFDNLGITTIWISPFYKTSAYHGYHITDFYQIDPHFGNLEDIKDLINAVHKYDIHIIADFVPNHCSRDHPFFKDAQSEKNSPYYDWFYFTKWPDEYLSFLSIKEIPKINLNNQQARNHIINAAKFWLDIGLDGFRLDHVIGPPHSFWKQFRKEIKDKYPNTILIGEAWMKGIKTNELRTINIKNKFLKRLFGTSSDSLLREYVGELDGVLDFKFQEILKNYVTNPYASKHTLSKNIKRHFSHFPENYLLPNFLDNNDMDRFLYQCGNDKEKLKEAAKVQFTTDQPIIIYYGTETGMTQTKSIWNIPSHGDLQARQPMNWKSQDEELLEFYKKIIKQKKNKKLGG